MIEVRGDCSVRRHTSQLETRWYQRISRILLRMLRMGKHISSYFPIIKSNLKRRPGHIFVLRAGESAWEYVQQTLIVSRVWCVEAVVVIGGGRRIPPDGATTGELTGTQTQQLVGVVWVLGVGREQRLDGLLIWNYTCTVAHRHITINFQQWIDHQQLK